ncbi:hypothetical protein AL073_13915 [Loktanella sp. 1ANDIMAR09]|nr:hypothetical protein AL073_13915 [Loktanella sp. 1ANDIMAR09]
MDLGAVSEWVLNSQWGKSLSRVQIISSFHGSSCVGLFAAGEQIGFGRAISDGVTSAYLKDIIILDAFQRKGFGRQLMQGLFEHPDLGAVPNWYLGTKDAHGFYETFGFRKSPNGIYMYLHI